MPIPTKQAYLRNKMSLMSRFIFWLFFILVFLVSIGQVNGQSMEPSFFDNDLFFVNKITYLIRTPERFEVVQYLDPFTKEEVYIKRVIALPGETVIFKSNGISIQTLAGDEFTLTEDYLYSQMITRVKAGQTSVILVPPDSYFLIGDNRLKSIDSRDFGAVHRRFINGKVLSF